MAFALANKASAGVSRVSSSRSSVKAQALQSWLPGSVRPAHLDGKLAGDFGFDPLGLGKDPKALKWYVEAELIHARLAMTAAAGIVLPALATKTGAVSIPQWYEAGEVYIKSEGAIPFATLAAIQLFATNFVEVKRWKDIENTGSQAEPGTFFGLESTFKPVSPSYPGGPFDPLGLSKDSAAFEDFKTKEIKNGRLAMLAVIGFIAQYKATGKGPIDNLFDHLASPFNTTFCDNGVSVPFF